MRVLLSLSAAIGLILIAACESPSRQTIAAGGLEQRSLGNAPPDAVLIEAAAILKREFGRAKINAETRSIETGYYEYSTARDSGTSRDLIGGRSQMRRKAMFIVGARGETTVARLRIDVERRDSEQQTVLQPRGARFGDSPGQESAIDRDAATTTSQNVVWNPVRRDYQLEKQILAELQEKFARLAAEEEPGPDSTGRPAAPNAPEKGKPNGQ